MRGSINKSITDKWMAPTTIVTYISTSSQKRQNCSPLLDCAFRLFDSRMRFRSLQEDESTSDSSLETTKVTIGNAEVYHEILLSASTGSVVTYNATAL